MFMVMIVSYWSFVVDKQSGFLCCTAPTKSGLKSLEAAAVVHWKNLLFNCTNVFRFKYLMSCQDLTVFWLRFVEKREERRAKTAELPSLCYRSWGSDAAGFHRLWQSRWKKKRAWNWYLMGYISPGVSHVLIWFGKIYKESQKPHLEKTAPSENY